MVNNSIIPSNEWPGTVANDELTCPMFGYAQRWIAEAKWWISQWITFTVAAYIHKVKYIRFFRLQIMAGFVLFKLLAECINTWGLFWLNHFECTCEMLIFIEFVNFNFLFATIRFYCQPNIWNLFSFFRLLGSEFTIDLAQDFTSNNCSIIILFTFMRSWVWYKLICISSRITAKFHSCLGHLLFFVVRPFK